MKYDDFSFSKQLKIDEDIINQMIESFKDLNKHKAELPKSIYRKMERKLEKEFNKKLKEKRRK